MVYFLWPAITDCFGHLVAAETSWEDNTNILSGFKLNLLANGCSFMHPTDTEQHLEFYLCPLWDHLNFSFLFLLWTLLYNWTKVILLVTMKLDVWYRLKCWRTLLWPNICQHVHIGIKVYAFMRALFQVISVLGIYLICWTKINAAGQAIVPQLGFNRPRWNWTDLWRNQNRRSLSGFDPGSWAVQGEAFGEEANYFQMTRV